MKKMKDKTKRIISLVLLIFSFLLISFAGYAYLLEYTNFSKQALELIGEIPQDINPLILMTFSLGLILFGFFIGISKRFVEILLIFLIDFLQILSSAFLILGLLGPFIISFRFGLIISSFIIYFVMYIAKENIPKIIKSKKDKKRK